MIQLSSQVASVSATPYIPSSTFFPSRGICSYWNAVGLQTSFIVRTVRSQTSFIVRPVGSQFSSPSPPYSQVIRISKTPCSVLLVYYRPPTPLCIAAANVFMGKALPDRLLHVCDEVRKPIRFPLSSSRPTALLKRLLVLAAALAL